MHILYVFSELIIKFPSPLLIALKWSNFYVEHYEYLSLNVQTIVLYVITFNKYRPLYSAQWVRKLIFWTKPHNYAKKYPVVAIEGSLEAYTSVNFEFYGISRFFKKSWDLGPIFFIVPI